MEVKNKKKFLLVLSCIVVIVIVGVAIYKINYNPPAVFDFDDGTTQGWTYNGEIYDDAGVNHGGKAFNPGMLNNLNNTLCFFPNQLGDILKDPKLGFPMTSVYWRIDIISPNLGPAWNKLKGIKVSIKDQLGLPDNMLQLKVFVRYSDSGKTLEIPSQTSFNPKLPHDKWTVVSENMNLPSTASPMKIILQIRGKWKDPNSPDIPFFEGQIFLDNVTKIL